MNSENKSAFNEREVFFGFKSALFNTNDHLQALKEYYEGLFIPTQVWVYCELFFNVKSLCVDIYFLGSNGYFHIPSRSIDAGFLAALDTGPFE